MYSRKFFSIIHTLAVSKRSFKRQACVKLRFFIASKTPIQHRLPIACNSTVSSRFFDLGFTSKSDNSSQGDRFSYNSLPVITQRKLNPSPYCSSTSSRRSRQAWVESLKPSDELVPSSCPINASPNCQPIGMVDLHPDLFSTFPRLDIVHKNLYWQGHYRMVDWRRITTRAELAYRSNRKPWPQKGTGKARHGNRRSPIWIGGGQCNGPRGPHSYFYLLPRSDRIAGLLSMLSIKQAQDDLHIVDNFALSQSLENQAESIVRDTLGRIGQDNDDDPYSSEARQRAYELNKVGNACCVYLRDLVDIRKWGPSVLFVIDDECRPDLPSLASTSSGDRPTDDKSTTKSNSLAINLACTSYARFVEAEQSLEASAFQFKSPAPRASHPGRGLTVMPVSGLNVWSLVHHDTLVLSIDSLTRIENRLLDALRVVGRNTSSVTSSSTIHPHPPDWFDDAQQEEDQDSFPLPRRRHFSGPIESAFWQRVQKSSSS